MKEQPSGNSYMNKNNRGNYAIVCLNVCNFRYINELWGEEAGDRTLGRNGLMTFMATLSETSI